ncbi:Palmitoyltransferase [Orbilia brochopaga]|uniref:Palmitoyltransferase PFA4 n=1 Tax=Orbilia brochopaga TaxID=3140254 RepID=A0AAV9TZX5_9PEZI
MLNPKYSAAAVAGTVLLITFLAYASQLFVLTLTREQFYVFNTLVGCIWVNYARCIFTDPGGVPAGWQPSWQKLDTFGGGDDDENEAAPDDNPEDDDDESSSDEGGEKRVGAREQALADKSGRIWGNADCRWCKRCKRWKPARAHHCKTCQKCVLLMDHHCPWTFNCVGYRTWPHFIRFLTYVIASCSYLQKFLVVKCLEVYRSRNMPAYMGPSLQQLMLLVFLLLFNTLTDVAIIVLWLRIVANIIEGYTTIECWEQERHTALVKRKTVRRQAFPFDIGIYENLSLFMGGGILTWLLPVIPNRSVGEGTDGSGSGGLRYEINGYEKSWLSWPPPDPEKFGIHERRHVQREMQSGPWTRGEYDVNDVRAFRRRQREDMKRFQGAGYAGDDGDEYASDGEEKKDQKDSKRVVDEDLLDSYLDSGYGVGDTYFDERQRQEQGRKRWRNEEGDTLADYGVDEDADMLGEEDSVPLAELLRRRREKQALLQQNKTL